MGDDRGDAAGLCECGVCGKGFEGPRALAVHERTHHKELFKFVCHTCSKGFKSKTALKCHWAVHTDARPFKCQECGTSFKTLGYLKQHEATHDEDRPRPYACSICDKRFFVAGTRDKHEITHDENRPRPHVCSFCSKGFTTSNTLKHHERIHTNEHPFVCEWCQMRFRNGSALRSHETAEHKDKPKQKCVEKDALFLCFVEGCKTASREGMLGEEHYDAHRGLLRLTCSGCGETFSAQEAHEAHVCAGTQQPAAVPPHCPVCWKAFASAEDVADHQVEAHGIWMALAALLS